VRPHGAECEQEGSVHDAFEMRGEAHADIRETVLCKAGEEPEQK
jgi:hypothetical protein